MTDRQAFEDEWERLVRIELRKTKSIIVAMARVRQQHPKLWADLHAPRTEHREEAMADEQQHLERIERQG